jgi:hypothetical protein
MSCRTGPLRVGRAFARLFNLSWPGKCSGLALLGDDVRNDQREFRCR